MKQVSDIPTPIESSGYLLPWNKAENQPCLILIEDAVFVPIFSDKEKLDAHLEFTKYKFEVSIKQIDNTDEFVDSVTPHYRVALNPRPTERNTTRFTELKLNSANQN